MSEEDPTPEEIEALRQSGRLMAEAIKKHGELPGYVQSLRVIYQDIRTALAIRRYRDGK